MNNQIYVLLQSPAFAEREKKIMKEKKIMFQLV